MAENEEQPELSSDGSSKKRKRMRGLKGKRLFKLLMLCVGLIIVWQMAGKFITFENGIPRLKKKEVQVEEKQSVSDIPLPVKAYKVAPIDFTDTLPALGNVKGYREIELKFSESGYIEYINFRDGEKAIEGDIIASLDQREALLKLEYAKNEMENNEKLYDLGSITEWKFQQSKLEYQSARLEYEKTNLVAPYDGYVGTIEKQKGDFLTPNDVFGTFVNLTDAYVEFGIIEKDIGKIKIGQSISMTVDSHPQDTFTGEIESISPMVEGRTRTFKVKARVINEDEKLKAGMFGRVGVLIYEKDNALVIPSSSFRKKEEEYFVFVIHAEGGEEEETSDFEGEDEFAELGEEAFGEEAGEEAPAEEAPQDFQEVIMGTIEVRPIQVEYATPSAVEIKAGLDEGEMIVSDIQQELEEKTKVEVTEVQENIF